ncbi:MAG: peptide chain release factor N(5)-glutamine methyltransferase [Dehalococcoidia bacterium]|nr:peptide chain release factor N(5)-glutamine methyltransferase [Dehalococcoidia bacterium]MDH4367084.1 peptide chain release factor N(5)-glutamine methyltransferase [Dehalococcoidia bacterium]
MILGEALQSVTQTLRRARIADASVEAEVLLGHVLGMSKTGLYTEPERSLTSAESERLRNLVRRRLDREPTAYILGHCEFYGIDFYIDSRALIPRPETELLVEEAVDLGQRISHQGVQTAIADVGTGCGAVAISLALALPQARIYATDISPSALQVAEVNCCRHGVSGRVELLQGNLLEPLPQAVDVIVANLPYVKDCEFVDLSPEIREYEPTLALAGGRDGLDKIREMFDQMGGKWGAHLGERPAYLLLEIGQGQGEIVTSLVNDHFWWASIELISDLGGIERVVKVGLRPQSQF